MQFFFELKKNAFFKPYKADLIELLKDPYEFQNFLGHFESVFKIAVETISVVLTLKTYRKLQKVQVNALREFFNKVEALVQIAEHFSITVKRSLKSTRKKDALIKWFYVISELNFSILNYVKIFFNLVPNHV